jgi:hypothetical protein
MADTKVSGLAAVAAFLSTHELPVNEAGTSKKVTGAQIASALPVTSTVPANPAATTSLTLVQAGLARTITPTFTGRVLILVAGDWVNNTASDGANVQITYGTGGAPVNGAAQTGTLAGALLNLANNANTANLRVPFVVAAIVTGLTLATAYWLDLAFDAVTGGSVSLSAISFNALEL